MKLTIEVPELESGWEYTGELRIVTVEDDYLSDIEEGKARVAKGPNPYPRLIVRRKKRIVYREVARNVPLPPRTFYGYVDGGGVYQIGLGGLGPRPSPDIIKFERVEE